MWRRGGTKSLWENVKEKQHLRQPWTAWSQGGLQSAAWKPDDGWWLLTNITIISLLTTITTPLPPPPPPQNSIICKQGCQGAWVILSGYAPSCEQKLVSVVASTTFIQVCLVCTIVWLGSLDPSARRARILLKVILTPAVTEYTWHCTILTPAVSQKLLTLLTHWQTATNGLLDV